MQHMGKLRVALVSHTRLTELGTGTPRHFMDIADVMSSLGHRVEAFTLSDEDRSLMFGRYKLHEIAGFVYPNEASLAKLADFIPLAVAGNRPLMARMNENIRLVKALDAYDPDVLIVGDFVIAPLLSKCRKRDGSSPHLVFLLDSYKGIQNNLNAAIAIGGPAAVLVKAALKRNYLRYNMNAYEYALRVASGVVIPGEPFMKEVAEKFPEYSRKLFVIPSHFIRDGSVRRSLPKTRIKRILFMGAYSSGPNREAISYIERDIAPRLPDKQFLIAGKGCPKATNGNVMYLGTVPDASKLIASSDLCLAPLKTGSGKKAKIFDYLIEQKAVLGTSDAFDGFPVRNRYNALVEDDISKYADRIRELDSDNKLFLKLQKNALTALKDESEKNVKRLWKELLAKLN